MKQTLFSGIQPSGTIHLGNYLGALRQWTLLQNEYDAIFCVVDLHAMTVYQEPNILRENTINTARTLLSLGVDPNKATLFVQSQVPAHTQLYWVLNTIAKKSELDLMTQYKDRVSHGKAPLAGLFNYPVLMAADILLYNAAAVPVGEDQIQHVELARTLARRFNRLYGDTFIVPKPIVNKESARIMGLDEPTKKMSKSASSASNYIALTDTPKIVNTKIGRAVTDSHNTIAYNPRKQPGISNLLAILSALSGTSIKQLEKNYKNKQYGEFKQDISDTINSFLKTFQERYSAMTPKHVTEVLQKGRAQAEKYAQKMIERVYKKVGLI